MATSQTGQSLRQVARALEKIPDDAVRDAAEKVVNDARAKGGTFSGKRLGAKIKPAGKGSVTVVGTPAGAWAIKSFGRGTSRARPGSVLGSKGGSFHSMHARPTRGDKRWSKVRENAEDDAPRIIGDAVRKALR